MTAEKNAVPPDKLRRRKRQPAWRERGPQKNEGYLPPPAAGRLRGGAFRARIRQGRLNKWAAALWEKRRRGVCVGNGQYLQGVGVSMWIWWPL